MARREAVGHSMTEEKPPISFQELLPYAAITGLAAFMPLRFASEFTLSHSRSNMIRNVAWRHSVGVDELANEMLLSHVEVHSSLGARAARRTAGWMLRRALPLVNVARSADQALQTFVMGHLLDRHCARQVAHETIVWITEPEAIRIRAAIDSGVRRASAAALKDVASRALGSCVAFARGLPGSMGPTTDELGDRDADNSRLSRVTMSIAAGVRGLGSEYLRRVEHAFDLDMGVLVSPPGNVPVRKRAVRNKSARPRRKQGVHVARRPSRRP